MENHNEWCKNNNCNHYQEWEYQPYSDDQPYPCFSCDLIGHSYNIERIAYNCPYT